MTDTTTAAVERFYFMSWGMAPSIGGTWVSHSDYAALSAQLEAAEAKLATAHSQGKAEGLREAADIVWSDIHNLDTWTRKFVRHALLSIIPADTPAERVTVQEANKRVARARDEALMEAAECIGHITRHEDLDAILALRAIAGGK